jgi:diguanylate cyclase (GGDEF)-like protein/PAS domain S-box-containing protein
MDYKNKSKEALIAEIERLESLNQYLLEEQQRADRLEFSWTGNLGHWYFRLDTNRVTYNPLKVIALGYDAEEVPEEVPYQFFTDKLHPEDHPLVMENMRDHLAGRTGVYEVEYRIMARDGRYKWYHDRGKITQYDQEGKPVLIAGIVFDVTERRLMQEELETKNRILEEKAVTDSLTDLKNHRALMEGLTKALEVALVTGGSLSIVFFDLDDFKGINDHYGHQTGDRVLRDFAGILKDSVRESDIVARYGGEEFVIVLPRASLKAAKMISERIRRRVEAYEFGDGIRVTVSGGIKVFDGESLGDLIAAADKKLYEAKALGKNIIVS